MNTALIDPRIVGGENSASKSEVGAGLGEVVYSECC